MFMFCVLNFRGWSQLQNCFNNEVFLIYGNCYLHIDDLLHIMLYRTKSDIAPEATPGV